MLIVQFTPSNKPRTRPQVFGLKLGPFCSFPCEELHGDLLRIMIRKKGCKVFENSPVIKLAI